MAGKLSQADFISFLYLFLLGFQANSRDDLSIVYSDTRIYKEIV